MKAFFLECTQILQTAHALIVKKNLSRSPDRLR